MLLGRARREQHARPDRPFLDVALYEYDCTRPVSIIPLEAVSSYYTRSGTGRNCQCTPFTLLIARCKYLYFCDSHSRTMTRHIGEDDRNRL